MTELFPPFCSNVVAPAYAHHFDVQDFRQGTVVNPEVVVSTSLFWGVTYLHEKLPELTAHTLFTHEAPRKNGRWWNIYMAPLLNACNQPLPENWQRRIYLSADLAIIKDIFPEHVTVVIMAENSPTSTPGMMWRYLPLLEPVMCVARGADNFWLPQVAIERVKLALSMKAALMRITLEMNLDGYGKNQFHYRSVCGSCSTQGPLPFMENVTSWIRTMTEDPRSLSSEYEGKEHTGMYDWRAFGQDEQFLCRWLYHDVVRRQGLILTDASHSRGQRLFLRDCSFLARKSVPHQVFFP